MCCASSEDYFTNPINRPSFEEVQDMVESEFGQDPVPGRNIKLYLCRKHTSEKLKTIGEQFGIGDAAVAQSCKRFKMKLEKNKNLRKKMEQLEKRIILSNVET